MSNILELSRLASRLGICSHESPPSDNADLVSFFAQFEPRLVPVGISPTKPEGIWLDISARTKRLIVRSGLTRVLADIDPAIAASNKLLAMAIKQAVKREIGINHSSADFLSELEFYAKYGEWY